MSFDEAIRFLSEDEAFRATVYAMNTLLQEKRIYQVGEFEARFCQYAEGRKNSFGQKSMAAAEISRATASANP